MSATDGKRARGNRLVPSDAAAVVTLLVHLETIHLYDFANTPVDDDDLNALDALHVELHRRGDYGAHVHRPCA